MTENGGQTGRLIGCVGERKVIPLSFLLNSTIAQLVEQVDHRPKKLKSAVRVPRVATTLAQQIPCKEIAYPIQSTRNARMHGRAVDVHVELLGGTLYMYMCGEPCLIFLELDYTEFTLHFL